MEINDKTRSIPSLDGMRAISILLVIVAHSSQNFSRWIKIPLGTYLLFAHTGVSVFFVISGFLITSLLLKELHATGTIGLKRFYLRRAFRIFPPFYLYWASSSCSRSRAYSIHRSVPSSSRRFTPRTTTSARGRFRRLAAHLVAQRGGAVLPSLAGRVASSGEAKSHLPGRVSHPHLTLVASDHLLGSRSGAPGVGGSHVPLEH